MTEGINYRRKAQNQKRELALLNKKCAQQQRYIEQLSKVAESYHEAALIAMEVCRKQAVKEFVALLKENSGAWGELTIEQIEQLAEEMVGEDE